MIFYNSIFIFLSIIMGVSYYFKDKKIENLLYIFLFFIFLIIFSIRYNMGGDWHAYNGYIIGILGNTSKKLSDLDAFGIHQDLFFDLIVRFSRHNMQQFIFIHSFFCLACHFYYCNKLEDKLFIILISYSFIFLFLYWGYLRQGLCFAFLLVSLRFFFNRSYFFALLALLISILNHKTGVIILPLYLYFIFKEIKLSLFYLLVGIVLVCSIVIFFYGNYLEYMFFHYLGVGKESGLDFASRGFYLRSTIFLSTSVFFLFFIKKFKNISKIEITTYAYFSILSIIMTIIGYLGLTTFADRCLLFFFPLILYVFSNMGQVFVNKNVFKLLIMILLISYINIWLLFSNFRIYFIPYDTIF